MKKFFLFLTLFATAISMSAQEMKVTAFDWDMMDLSAQTHAVTDKEGKVCALLKVEIAQANVNFVGNVVGTPTNKTGEYWVYLTDGAEALTVKTENCGVVKYTFPQPLKSKQTYILTIEIPLPKTMDDAKKMVHGAHILEFEKVKGNLDVNKIIHVRTESVYPTGQSLVDNAIREYINEELGGSYVGSLKDGKSMMLHYAQKKLAENREDAQERYNEKMPEYRTDDFSYRFLDSIYVAFENEKLITLRHYVFEYSGGAEAFTTSYSVTFRKSDGRIFDYGMMKNLGTSSFRRLFIEGLKEAISQNLRIKIETDKELLKWITIPFPENYGPIYYDEDNQIDYDRWNATQVEQAINDIELPDMEHGFDRGEVFVSSEGVTFVYPSYGISGNLDPWNTRLKCTIKFKDIRPFVISTIASCLPNE